MTTTREHPDQRIASYRRNGRTWLVMRCACGETFETRADTGALTCWDCKSKNHSEYMTKHGGAYTKAYVAWTGMISRCYRPGADSYPLYGGRGIKVCDRWRASFANFFADMGECPSGLTLERNDCNRDYEPENCRWATKKEQARNTRRNRFVTLSGKTMVVADAAQHLGIDGGSIARRVRRNGETHQEALEHFASVR